MGPFLSPACQEKLQELRSLVVLLPDTLPIDPSPSFQSVLDNGDVGDIGYPGALNKLFHHVWGIPIEVRGSKLDATLELLEHTLSHTDDPIVHLWVDSFCNAARAAGASGVTLVPRTLTRPPSTLPTSGSFGTVSTLIQDNLGFSGLKCDHKMTYENDIQMV